MFMLVKNLTSVQSVVKDFLIKVMRNDIFLLVVQFSFVSFIYKECKITDVFVVFVEMKIVYSYKFYISFYMFYL